MRADGDVSHQRQNSDNFNNVTNVIHLPVGVLLLGGPPRSNS
jgi:hypothetical protein